MANEEQLAILRQGVEIWNKWREENPEEKIDLTDADLGNIQLTGVDLTKARLIRANLFQAQFSGADLSRANIRKANLFMANLSGAKLDNASLKQANLGSADLSGASLIEANLSNAELRNTRIRNANLEKANLYNARMGSAVLWNANLTGVNLTNANLNHTNLDGANLSHANLTQATLINTNVSNASISGSTVYGINVWDLVGEFKEQDDLIVTHKGQPVVTVDDIKVAQFIYMILNNGKIRDVINTLTSKSVLILGRFAIPERKAILDALRNKLREYNLLPIVFDFDRPTDKDFTETIKTLAGISYFVIADVTNPKSSPLELQATVPDYQIPFVPIIQEGESPFAMMVDLQKKFPWVLPTRSYDSIETLMQALKPGIIDPAVEMRNKLRLVKAQEHPTESLKDYLDKSL